ncbi:8-oxo-dGTP pyrophosphatase MutT (NUDIX family) [Mycetocola sp. BIGb0189]|uniref:NUDIX hydrolase n=1 Tax=Mycetocola sp. BIGb0189 TaxID=2940604 RepID=UPI002169EFD7|nr:NUDIX domain-containing protein [Mycetocola sp. BIGb0189]MCS4277994.1 8-oxo-dGTP pyrophosphatase MutT (NUDIX family) [Mycetocola sp. BIGb0189]
MSHPTLPDIQVAAFALVRDRRLLMVTARGRDVYFLPGGKIDSGETPRDAVIREVFEEVGARVDPDSLAIYHRLALQAHGEPEGRLVAMTIFSGELLDEPVPSAEVSELHWVRLADADRCPPAGADLLHVLHRDGLID